MSNLFKYVPHPRIAQRRTSRPTRIKDQLPHDNPVERFNAKLAVTITNGVGTMWCAYAFALLAFVSLPAAIRSGDPVILVSWISQTFLQLVLLSIIMVGQNVQGAAADKRAEATYEDADAVLQTSLQIQAHLEAQDTALERIMAAVAPKSA